MNIRRNVRYFLAFTATPLVALGIVAAIVTAEPSTTRPATPYEAAFCSEHFAEYGPVTDDCTVVPLAGYVTPDGTILDGTVSEDDPFGRWDCVSIQRGQGDKEDQFRGSRAQGRKP